MNRLLAGTAVLALCAFGAASADTTPDNAAQSGASLSTNVDAQIAKAQALRKEGHLPEAASALAQLMLMAPDNPHVVGEYGKVMAQEGRGEDALAFLKRATELQQDDWTLYSALGVAYDQNNDAKDASGAYQRALALKPGDPTVLNNYGMSRMMAGDLTGAQEMFMQAQVAGRDNPKIVNNAAMLAEMENRKAPPAHVAMTPVRVQQTVAMKPLPDVAKPQITATAAPKAMAAQTKIAALAGNPQVVMQAVPKDPLAGPVKPKIVAAHAPRKLAKTPNGPAPVLRTAADTH
jgi:Flp pilus assembly protein TadD